MRIQQSAFWGASLAVIASGVVEAHGSHGPEAWNTLNGRSFFEPSEVSTNLTARGVTNCGPAYGGASCDSGQCCSQDGKCGTGQYYCNAPSCLYQYGPACDANQVPPGTNTASVARPHFGSVPYGVSLTHCTVPGKVALTFDDGPWLYTNDLLDLLKQQNVKATFFVVGNNGGKGQIESSSTAWPTVLKRIYSEGHQLASHSWSHQDLSTLNSQQITDQVIRNEIAFADVFGFIPTYMRPPYGRCYGECLSIMQKYGYHVVNFDLDTLDWQENYDASRNIFSSAIKSSNPSKDSFIPLTHDIHYGTVHGFVQFMLDTLRAAGYTTATVGECMNDPRQNWYRDTKSGAPVSSVAAAAAVVPTTTTTAQATTPTTTTTVQTTAQLMITLTTSTPAQSAKTAGTSKPTATTAAGQSAVTKASTSASSTGGADSSIRTSFASMSFAAALVALILGY